jgi:hypothetical protein
METRIYSPTTEDLQFSSKTLGISYAQNAGFDVILVSVEDDTAIASRDDMPGVSFKLETIGDSGLWVWVRR